MPKPHNNTYLKYTALGFQMAATIGIFVGIGIALDRWLTAGIPIFVIIFALVGVVGTMISLIKELSPPSQAPTKSDKKQLNT